jgi:hypothetical protein
MSFMLTQDFRSSRLLLDELRAFFLQSVSKFMILWLPVPSALEKISFAPGRKPARSVVSSAG